MASDGHLPPETWSEVLVRLPAKSILRCRSVCKSWYSLISCPDFISRFSSETLNKNRNNRLLLRHCDIRSESFSSLDESFMESREHDDFVTPKGIFVNFQFVGSCNGLICLSKYVERFGTEIYRMAFLVWNPTIRKTVGLPSRTYAQLPSYIGFGFDSKTNDYKVLCAMDNECEIFDLRKGVWRSISPLTTHPRRCGSYGQECYLDGAVHWTNRSDMILLSFNMSDECFGDIEMPDLCGSFTDIRSVAFGGLIHVMAWKTKWSCAVWVMKEYGVPESWTKVSNFRLPINQIEPQTSSALLWDNGEVLMVKEGDFGCIRQLVFYNTKRRRFKCVLPFINKPVENMCLYEESLAFIRGNGRVLM